MPVPYSKMESPWDKIPICYPATTTSAEGSGVILEIGPGRGDFLFHLAEINPRSSIIGIELKSKRYFKLIDRIIKHGLKNVQLIQADGRKAVATYFKENSINEIHINFPDPWPKNKHGKNRLLNADFIAHCTKILCIDGMLSFVTDAKFYAEDVNKLIVAMPECHCGPHGPVEGGEAIHRKQLSSGDCFVVRLRRTPRNDMEVYPTFFAQKWQKLGREIYCQRWMKTSQNSLVSFTS